jgi:molecular chaperone GrpE
MKRKSTKETIQEAAVCQDILTGLQDAGDSEMTVEALTQQLQVKEKEAAENQDKYLRAVAELENYKKRAARDRADSLKYGQENLIKDILPLVDNLDRAMAHACKSNDFEAFKEGLRLVQNQLNGCHEAMLQVESPDHEHNQVVEEFEKGYLLNGRLLRPSKVSVCRLPVKEEAQ